ncbi:hypothetical protein E6Q11_01505 [Candidatus Dojkabacteria bacterium]|uniref:Calcineurin-like phosphoesterase domain-containing protein n=1 Tax=Candidatus Dojkabacteria bacterium TaxID=2099670 RepID=A0A5C7JAG6_9BACT|nr:MAG: hypothetical protein E6Q11_01505 [Candidatus Dojkabacteria bacterium]
MKKIFHYFRQTKKHFFEQWKLDSKQLLYVRMLLIGLVLFGAGLLVGWRAPHLASFWLNPPHTFKEPPIPSIELAAASFFKIGFVTDWEYGDKQRLKQKITSEAPIELRRVVRYFNDTFRPDLVVGGGDYIESSNAKPERAKEQLREMNEIYAQSTAPRMYAFGDHDFRSLTQAEVIAALEIESTHEYRDVGDWRIIVIDPNYNKENEHRNAKQYVFGHMSPAELTWLEAALQTDRPVIVFSHYSPIPIPNSKGQYIENIDNASHVREILERSKRVAAVFSGHNPMGYYEERQGIHYFVIDTLVNRKSMGSFATIEARYLKTEDYVHFFVRQYGMNKVEYAVDGWVGKPARHLITNPPFEFQMPDEVTENELLDQ